MNRNSFSNWINIDLNAIEHNTSLLAAQAQAPVMAVVKANAYGHGTLPVARAALRGSAEWLGVARVEEALELRSEKFSCPILVMGLTPENSYRKAVKNDISLTVWSQVQIETISSIARELGLQAKIHLKVDTGMSRLGAAAPDCLFLAEMISKTGNIFFEGIFTHYARADELDQSSAKQQEREFIHVLDELKTASIEPPFIHAENSAASIFLPNSRFNLIRPGISIYGLHPSHERLLPGEFKPALEWKAVLSQVKCLPAGRGVSYGHEYITQKNERIGTIPVGYADGFRRIRGNQVLVGGKLVPVVGRVCMDQVCVQLDDVPDAVAGDEVVLIGSQGSENITAEQVAGRWGTINYEVVCGLAARVPRVYLNPDK